MHVHVHVQMHVHVYVHVHVQMHVHVHVQMHVHIHIHVHVHLHVYSNTNNVYEQYTCKSESDTCSILKYVFYHLHVDHKFISIPLPLIHSTCTSYCSNCTCTIFTIFQSLVNLF